MDGVNMTDETLETENAEELERLNFNAREIEQEMIRQAQERSQDPTETAAQMYSMYIPHYKRAVSKLSTRGLRRVLNNLILYPLEQDDIKAASQFEKEMMQLVNGLVEAKFIMILDQYRLNAEQLYEAATTPLTAEQEAEVKQQIEESKE